jgi:hypothetical protein
MGKQLVNFITYQKTQHVLDTTICKQTQIM